MLGNRVLRTEDPKLLTGAARYLADLPESLPREGLVYATFVGSYLPHGTITSIDADDARCMPGVAAVWTAEELDVAPHFGFVPFAPAFARPPLAQGRVRFVGEPVAVVFADTQQQAADAAEAVIVELEPLPHETDAEAALSPSSEMLFPDHGSNVALTESPDQPFDIDGESDVVVRGRYVNQRVAVAPMEPHCFAAAPTSDGRLTIWPSNQMPHVVHMQIAPVLGVSRKEIHVITPQVGGGFGGKAGLQHQYTVVATAARRLNRPVVWVPTRTEDMQSAPQGRGQVQYAELGCRADGTFTGLKVRLVGDAGAYPNVGAFLPGGTRRMSHGTYNFGRIEFDIAVAVTNTAPMGAYRGAGRPEATALLERLVDQASHELGIDPIELRERNLLTDDVFPFTTITGNVYDSGSYRLPLHTAADAIGYHELRLEQQARRERGALQAHCRRAVGHVGDGQRTTEPPSLNADGDPAVHVVTVEDPVRDHEVLGGGHCAPPFVSALISTSTTRPSSINRPTSTKVHAGLSPTKTSPCARPAASQWPMSVRYTRVRTTSAGVAPSSARAATISPRM